MDNTFFVIIMVFAWVNVLTFEKRAKKCVIESKWAKWKGIPVYKIGWFAYPVILSLWMSSDYYFQDMKEFLRWGICFGLFVSSSRQAWGLRWLDDPCTACLSGHFCNLLIILLLALKVF